MKMTEAVKLINQEVVLERRRGTPERAIILGTGWRDSGYAWKGGRHQAQGAQGVAVAVCRTYTKTWHPEVVQLRHLINMTWDEYQEAKRKATAAADAEYERQRQAQREHDRLRKEANEAFIAAAAKHGITLATGSFGDIRLTNEDKHALTAVLNSVTPPWVDGESTCAYCGEPIFHIDGIWVDATEGDCCSGDDNLVNENEVHTPKRRMDP